MLSLRVVFAVAGQRVDHGGRRQCRPGRPGCRRGRTGCRACRQAFTCRRCPVQPAVLLATMIAVEVRPSSQSALRVSTIAFSRPSTAARPPLPCRRPASRRSPGRRSCRGDHGAGRRSAGCALRGDAGRADLDRRGWIAAFVEVLEPVVGRWCWSAICGGAAFLELQLFGGGVPQQVDQPAACSQMPAAGVDLQLCFLSSSAAGPAVLDDLQLSVRPC